ncbi:MAG: hypothetical protein QF475_02845 [Candidatus Undinarchaeales archaeon]|jgi:lipid-A-disaccharide synthase-like uncharacterized protein|nr:hypothetical protein [Candidatus Undinarchaeales archaeon]
MTALPILGLGFITIAWLVQFYMVSSKKKKTFDVRFLVIYAVGAFALAYVGFIAKDMISGGLYLVIGLMALVIGYYTK